MPTNPFKKIGSKKTENDTEMEQQLLREQQFAVMSNQATAHERSLHNQQISQIRTQSIEEAYQKDLERAIQDSIVDQVTNESRWDDDQELAKAIRLSEQSYKNEQQRKVNSTDGNGKPNSIKNQNTTGQIATSKTNQGGTSTQQSQQAQRAQNMNKQSSSEAKEANLLVMSDND